MSLATVATFHRCVQYSQIHRSWLGDKVNSGTGLSYRPGQPCSPACRYDSPICRSWLYPPVRDLWIRLQGRKTFFRPGRGTKKAKQGHHAATTPAIVGPTNAETLAIAWTLDKDKSMDASNSRANSRRNTCNSMGTNNIIYKGMIMDVSNSRDNSRWNTCDSMGTSNSIFKGKIIDASNSRDNSRRSTWNRVPATSIDKSRTWTPVTGGPTTEKTPSTRSSSRREIWTRTSCDLRSW